MSTWKEVEKGLVARGSERGHGVGSVVAAAAAAAAAVPDAAAICDCPIDARFGAAARCVRMRFDGSQWLRLIGFSSA